MARIKVTPEQVRQVASQFKQASGDSQQMVNRLSQTVNGLQPDWEGMTKERFYQDFQQWSTSMRQFVELLNNIGQQLDAIAARFAQADQQG
jgi:WXG100 family type VII secretion target